MYTQFERFKIKMTLKQAKSVSHQGECLPDVLELLKNKEYMQQFKKIRLSDIAAELKEYGAWDEEELNNIVDNQQRITWIAGCGIMEDYKEKTNEKV